MTSQNPISFEMIKAAGISLSPTLTEVLLGRSDLIGLSQQAHDACLKPQEPGGITYTFRAALAGRISSLHEEFGLADHYKSLIPHNDPAIGIVDPSLSLSYSATIEAMIKHSDIVTKNPRTVDDTDIKTLEANGLTTSDIVRLSEIIAFMNYAIRVIKGIRLMGEI